MISVIIPVFNAEEYLYISINSILKQTYKDLEIICINDASTDSSKEILDYFAKKDSRIKIIKNDSTKGIGYCLNYGLKIANGKYISFLNTNDWISFNAFETLIKIAESKELDLLFYSESNFNDESYDFLNNINYSHKLLNSSEKQIFNHFDLDKKTLFELSPTILNKLYLKSFLDENKIRFSEENLNYNPIPFFYKTFLYAKRISIISDSFYNHREKEIISSNSPDEKIFDVFYMIYEIFNVFFKNKQLYQYYKTQLLNKIFSYLIDKYQKIDETLKERFYLEIQSITRNLINHHKLFLDIIENVPSEILNLINFNEIVEKIKNPPKVTIVVPVYNTENYLCNVIDSIINQTIGLDNIEVILVDDCSTDNCGKIIDEYSKKYNSITGIHLLENSQSPSKPRNIGIRNASSEYIIFQDSDDGFIKNACECLYDTINKENVDLVTGMIAMNHDGENYKLIHYPWNIVLSQYKKFQKEDIEKLLEDTELLKIKLNSINENPFVLMDYALNSIIFRKSFLMDYNIKFPERLNGGEDSVFLFNSYINAKGIVFINKIIYNYNVCREDSLTHNFSDKPIQSRPQAYRLMYDMAVKNNKKEIFVDKVLFGKINYWFTEHLFKAPHLEYNTILSIFKTQKILFSECVNYNLDLPEIIKIICIDIQKDHFEDAIEKVKKHRNALIANQMD